MPDPSDPSRARRLASIALAAAVMLVCASGCERGAEAPAVGATPPKSAAGSAARSPRTTPGAPEAGSTEAPVAPGSALTGPVSPTGLTTATVPTAPVTRESAPPDRAAFRPSTHGFGFRNSFTGSPLPVSLGKLDAALGVPQHYGLCGGMSAAAADFFLAGRPIPTGSEPPAKGTPLYSYIFQRQVDSLGTSLTFAKIFAEWMTLPDAGLGGTRARSIACLPILQDRLAQGDGWPAMLGLVLTSSKDRGKLWENHQVMAYSLTPGQGGLGFDVHIYDPNFPDNDGALIRIRPTVEGTTIAPLCQTRTGTSILPVVGIACTRTAPGRRETPVRGMFVMPYEFNAPPGELK